MLLLQSSKGLHFQAKNAPRAIGFDVILLLVGRYEIDVMVVPKWVRRDIHIPDCFVLLKCIYANHDNIFGTVGLVLIEGWSFFDAAYMVVITLPLWVMVKFILCDSGRFL